MAQLYIGDPAAGEPPRQLRGFQRVTLRPGQRQEVHFSLPASALAYWDTASRLDHRPGDLPGLRRGLIGPRRPAAEREFALA